jgi:hypothetical protein
VKGPFRPLFLSFSLWRRDSGAPAFAPDHLIKRTGQRLSRASPLHRQSLRPPALKKSAARPEQNRSDQKSSLSEQRTVGTERVSKIFAEMLRR